jgi:putative mRNA 3-end processing factor
VLLGNYVACDAFDESKPLRVVSHAHADHMIGLQKSLKKCENVLMTNATKDLIDAMQGPLSLMGGRVHTLGYNETMQHKEERITLFKADHILGAAQVLIEDAEGNRLVYTGDFRIDETPILDADELVVEATYGSPSCKRSFNAEPQKLLVSLIEESLKKGTVYVFGFHGKLQEVMQILHNAKVKVPFVMPEKVFHVSKVCENHGMRLGRLMLSTEKEAKEMLEKNAPCIAFYHVNSRKTAGADSCRIYVSGWEFGAPCRQIADKEYIIALSDHSDFNGLIEYVERSRPKQVITDNFRISHAETLAAEIRKRLGIPAVALPRKHFS